MIGKNIGTFASIKKVRYMLKIKHPKHDFSLSSMQSRNPLFKSLHPVAELTFFVTFFTPKSKVAHMLLPSVVSMVSEKGFLNINLFSNLTFKYLFSTNLAKIAFWLVENGFRIMIAACDTFRAGAIEQLRTHSHRINGLHPDSVQVFQQGYGKDAATIAMHAISAARDQKYDVVLIDTAGTF